MRGKIIVLTAPSGSGKTTLAKKLLADYSQIRFSVSATTRKPREGEENGVHYFFITPEEFREQIATNGFLEYEEFYGGTLYGTLKSHVENQLNSGYFVLLDIEVNGARNIKNLYGDQCLSIFVRPPSIESLRERLTQRGTESETTLKLRLERAEMELQRANLFDAVVINDRLEDAYRDLTQLIEPFISNP